MFIDIARSRHSCRDFTDAPLTEEERRLILEAGDLAPSSKGRRPVRLVPITDIAVIRSLSDCKDSGARAMSTATFAVAVAADPSVDTWVEDSSIATIMMQLEAEDLGLGSCWIQLRMRSRQGEPAEIHTKEVLGIDPSLSVLAVVAFGRRS
ncbi:MAG: nitroreductase family protein [Thermoplasmata archaeon]|nr:nitroreductase family protein [Thermoplasmata archaeon]